MIILTLLLITVSSATTKPRFEKNDIEEYLKNSDLDPIEGEWVYSVVMIYSEVIQGKTKESVNSNTTPQEYYIVGIGTNEFVLIEKSKLGQTYPQDDWGEIRAIIKKDNFDKNKYYFTYHFEEDDSIIEMTLNNNEIRGVYTRNSTSSSWSIKTTFKLLFYKENDQNFVGSNQEYAGTGFLVSEPGYIVTNYHVIEHNRNIEVIFPQTDKKYFGSVYLQDKNNDLAIIKLSDFRFSDISKNPIPYSVKSSKTVTIGTKVFTLGFPLTDLLGSSVKYSSGSITSSKDNSINPVLMQIDNNIQPGNSGSPLFNSSGDVIGIVVSSLNAGFILKELDFIPQNVNFAIRSDYLQLLLGDINTNQSSKETYKNMSIEDKITAISPFIAIINVEK